MFALGLGVATLNGDNQILEVFYPAPLVGEKAEALNGLLADQTLQPGESRRLSQEDLQSLAENAGADLQAPARTMLRADADRKTAVVVLIDTDQKPASTEDVYLRLHLLSHRLAKPHQQNLEGMFGMLPNVAWTSEGAIDLQELTHRQLEARIAGRVLRVHSIDKFPPMTDYVVPAGVRIADTARVRLGAYVGEGTTVMHEGFINFNAGTEGTSMIEGRISAGVMVGEGSDLGGGCSTMGTLSGGGNIIISVGKNSLIGANAGIGIPLGDDCKVEAGLYLTAGTRVAVLDENGAVVENTKARELAGKPGLLFRRNSENGRVEVLTNKSAIQLNEMLHAHN